MQPGGLLCWGQYDKPAVNTITQEAVTAPRRRIRTELDLPVRDEYNQFVWSLLPGSSDSISP